MDGEHLFMLIFGLIILGYVILYLSGRNYLRDGFQSGAGANSPTVGQLYPTPMPILQNNSTHTGSGRVLMEHTSMDPTAKNSIQKMDDYEYNLIYQNESDKELSKEMRDKLMSQRPLEWAGLPPSSSQFQAGLRESFENATPSVPDNAEPFAAVNGGNMIPPDTESTEMEERKMLQSYKAPSAKELSSYNPDEDPEALINRLYETKGLVPTVAHKMEQMYMKSLEFGVR